MKGKNNSFKRSRDVEISREKETQTAIFQLNYQMGTITPCWLVIRN